MHYIIIGFYKDLLLLLLWKLMTQKRTREKKLYIHIYMCVYIHIYTHTTHNFFQSIYQIFEKKFYIVTVW